MMPLAAIAGLALTASSVNAATVGDFGFELNDGSWTTVAAAGNQSGVQAHGSRNGYTNGPGASGPSTLHQTLSDVITDGNTYTLTIDIGQHGNFSGSEGEFFLFGSISGIGTPLSNANRTALMTGIAPPSGQANYIHDLQVTYTALASDDPFAGQSIGIALVGTSGIQVVWDEVRLDIAAVPIAAVPEPSTTALLGLGGLSLILRRRK